MSALLPHIWSTLLGTLVIEFAVVSILVPSYTLVQQATLSALIGRVGSTVISIILTAQIFGMVFSG